MDLINTAKEGSGKVDKATKCREYLKYLPKMEFTLFCKNDKLQTKMFYWEGEKIPDDSDIEAKSRVKFTAAWFSHTRGNFGLTIKPKLMQIMSKGIENDFEKCLLTDNEDPSRRLSDTEYEKPVCLNPD